MAAEDFITVYHTSPLEKPPHLFPVTQSVENFLGGKTPYHNMHAGTIEAALHRSASTEARQTYLHAYRMPKSLVDTSLEYFDNAKPRPTVKN